MTKASLSVTRCRSSRDGECPRQAGDLRVPIPHEHKVWATYAGQGRYERIRLSEVKAGCERPLVVEVADDLYAALAEARLVDYARMKFAPVQGVANALERPAGWRSGLGKANGELLTTPWRVVMVAPSPGRLLENNFLILNLNEPCRPRHVLDQAGQSDSRDVPDDRRRQGLRGFRGSKEGSSTSSTTPAGTAPNTIRTPTPGR